MDRKMIRQLIETDGFDAKKVSDLLVRSVQTVADQQKQQLLSHAAEIQSVSTELETALQSFVSSGEAGSLDTALNALSTLQASLGNMSAAVTKIQSDVTFGGGGDGLGGANMIAANPTASSDIPLPPPPPEEDEEGAEEKKEDEKEPEEEV